MKAQVNTPSLKDNHLLIKNKYYQIKVYETFIVIYRTDKKSKLEEVFIYSTGSVHINNESVFEG